MKKYKVPSITECYKIMQKHMSPHIKAHSKQVMEVALAIINNLKPSIKIDKKLVLASCLLHDITKAKAIITHEPHDQTGGNLIRQLGYYKVAGIIKEHVALKNFNPDGKLLEKEIVFYADKRVMHDKIVTVEERIADILVRYGRTKKRRREIMQNKEIILQIEKKINKYMKVDLDTAIHNSNGIVKKPSNITLLPTS